MSFVKRAVAIALIGAVPGFVWAADCSPDQVDLRYNGATVRFSVEVVDTPQTRATGLMHRESMPQFAGMLFIYEKPQPVGFWMKNTLIPLDMLFIDETGVVRNIKQNATPLSIDVIEGGEGILEVLEVNGGKVAELGLGIGAELRHPSLDQETAVWPCTED